MKKENEILKDENRTLKVENEILKKENESIKNENKILKKRNEDLQIKFDELNLIKDEEIKKLNEKYEILKEEKKNIIANLMLKLNKIAAEFRKSNGLSNREKLIAINFISTDKNINHSIICKNKTKFFDIESELYRKYPECRENENFYTLNGFKINKWKTLEENGINGYIIKLNKKDNE